MNTRTLRAFVSSRTVELHNERAVLKEALAKDGIDAFVFELDSGARPETAEQAFLDEVAEADLYVGVFWNEYSAPVVEEFRRAQELVKPCLVYLKTYAAQREPPLETFLRELRDPKTGVTVRHFETVLELAVAAKFDIQIWLVRDWRRKSARVALSDTQRLRLALDARLLKEYAQQTGLIRIIAAEGQPPTRYVLQLVRKGVVAIDVNGEPVFSDHHLVEITMHSDYPMSLPFIKMTSPVFHPNIYSSGTVCMGWFELPYTLPAVCTRLLLMIDYSIYAPQFPSNHRAAQWVLRRTTTLPLRDTAGRPDMPEHASAALCTGS